jgi:pSer/pThr/pTyr-binding forkhead associated (FHA) protein
VTRTVSFQIREQGELLRVVELEEPTIRIGNAATSHIRLDHPSVSRIHCVLEVGAELVLIDLGGESGTFVNAAPVTRAVIRSGDQLRVGAFTLDVIAAEATNLFGSPIPLRRVPAASAPPLSVRAPSILDLDQVDPLGHPAPVSANVILPRLADEEPEPIPRLVMPRSPTLELTDSDLIEVSRDGQHRDD